MDTTPSLTTTVVASDLAEYVGTTADAFVSSCLSTAIELVARTLQVEVTTDTGTSTAYLLVPAEVTDRAILEAGSELFHRRQAPNGVAQFAALDGAPVRVARDPMVAARPILAPYLPGGFG